MREEIFDVVNERDEVIDRKPRREVHARGLWHRAVHVLVFNARGEVFLQKRSLKKDIAAGKWDSSSSGHLDTGEDYDACAVREMREEIGLHLTQAPQRLFSLAVVGRVEVRSSGTSLQQFNNGRYVPGESAVRGSLVEALEYE